MHLMRREKVTAQQISNFDEYGQREHATPLIWCSNSLIRSKICLYIINHLLFFSSSLDHEQGHLAK